MRLVPSNQFLTAPEDFAAWARGRRRLVMEDFYRWQRVRLRVLVDDEDRPVGGRWNFDRDNRRPPVVGLHAPDPQRPEEDEIDAGVRRDLDGLGLDLWGEDGPRYMAATPAEARRALDAFVRDRLAEFGPWQPRAPTCPSRARRASSARCSAGVSTCGGCTGCAATRGPSATRSPPTVTCPPPSAGSRRAGTASTPWWPAYVVTATPTTSSASWSWATSCCWPGCSRGRACAGSSTRSSTAPSGSWLRTPRAWRCTPTAGRCSRSPTRGAGTTSPACRTTAGRASSTRRSPRVPKRAP
ncbi:MAG: cryptochrome/photolyase family protein [Solirubrobacterales bacterium]|nr:cryptochrome/photolyase family protein [Solirubrobacterales bacterium]